MKILISVLSALALSVVSVTGVPVGKNVKYTPEEQTALTKFREVVGPLPQPYMNTDGYLINWIRGSDSGGAYKIYRNATYSKYVFAPGFDVEEAAKKFEKVLAWRKENKIDGILSEDFSALKKQYPFDISRKDRDGRPVFLLEFSNWDLNKATEASPAEMVRFLRYYDYLLESVAAKARQSQTTDYTILIDVAGFNLDTHACPKCLALYTYFPTHLETHYPQMIKNLLSVNAPKEYASFNKLLASNFSPSTQKVYKTFDNNKDKWLKEVGKIIPVDQIPQHFVEGTKKPSPVVYPWVAACAGCKVTG